MPKKRKEPSDFLKAYYRLTESLLDTEEWKVINLGDDPLYEISNNGRVRRISNGLIINPFHSYRKDQDGNFIKERPTYLRVQLYYYENGIRKKKHFEISRLVALHFIPIPKKYIKKGYTPNTLEVNHKIGGYHIYNNCVNNLEWCTTQENIDKAFETGLRHPPRGMKHHAPFLTDNDVVEICTCLEKKMNALDTYNTMNREFRDRITFNRFKPNFYNIKYRNSWKFISQNFNF